MKAFNSLNCTYDMRKRQVLEDPPKPILEKKFNFFVVTLGLQETHAFLLQ